MMARAGVRRVTPSNKKLSSSSSSSISSNRSRRLSFLQFPSFRTSSFSTTGSLDDDDCNNSQYSKDNVIISSEESTEVIINNESARTLFELGINEYKMKSYHKAINFWLQSLRTGLMKDETDLLLSLVKVYVELKQLEPENASKYDINAKRYLNKLRPYFERYQTESIVEPSALLLDFFVEQKEWDGAIQQAMKLDLKPDLIARFYYERGIETGVSTSIRMDSMTKILSFRPSSVRLVLAAHAELIKLHTKTGNYLKALKHHEERLALLENKTDITKAFYEEGELYLALGNKDKALLALEKGLEINPKSKTLQQAKADLLYLFGRIDESNEINEELLERTKDPLEKAKILYTMGRICHKAGRRKEAKVCYLRELQITQKHLVDDLECSRIYHELAQLSEESCEYDEALSYLKKALNIEKTSFSQVKDKVQLMNLMRHTQKHIGKIHYKKGDFSRAFQEVF